MSWIVLDKATAEALAALLIVENQGAASLRAQRPLDAIERGKTILVKGTPYKDHDKGLSFCTAHVIFSKNDAEIVDYGFDGRLTLSAQQEAHWHGFMSHEDFDRVFGPRKIFDVERKSLSMDLFRTANGGLLNSADFVVSYAALLLKRAWRTELFCGRSLRAEETSGLWRVTTAGPQALKLIELVRWTGRISWLAPHPP